MDITQEDIVRLVRLTLGKRQVSEKDLLLENLGAESVDILNLVAALEEKYSVSIPEEDIPGLRTASDIYAYLRRAL